MSINPIIPPAVPQPKGIRPRPVPNPAARAGFVLAGIPGGENFGQPLPAGMAASAALPENGEIRPGFMQLPWVQDVLPFVTSLTLHATIIIVGFLTIQAIRVIKEPPSIPEIVIPTVTTVDSGPPGGVKFVGLENDPFRQAAQSDPTSGTPQGFDSKKGPAVELRAAGGEGVSNDSVIGPGAGKRIGGKGGPGSGAGDGSGPLGIFGAPRGGAMGAQNPIFGHNGNVKTLVFVCDCTGSMINKLPTLKVELEKTVMSLKPVQSFTVIFYQDEGYRIWQKQLTPATPENKQRFSTWVNDIQSGGQTDPLPALDLGLKFHPEVMYFLTDAADFPDPSAVVNLFRKGNARNRVKINTILFVDSAAEQETNKESEPLMHGIANDSGGAFKWVRLDELQ